MKRLSKWCREHFYEIWIFLAGMYFESAIWYSDKGDWESVMFYISFTENLAKIHNKKLLNSISKEQKLLLIAGDQDPVGNYGKSVETLHNIYKEMGLDSSIILYSGLRHELLNEDDKNKVMNDVLSFFER